MSGKIKIDRRSRQTRQRIGGAFLKLGGVQAINLITVDGLAREAGIARSTFYSHYEGIDDYIARSFANMLSSTANSELGVQALPIRAILEHIAVSGEGARALLKYRNYAKMMRRGENALREVAAKRLRDQPQIMDEIERKLLATMLAAGFISMLQDWIEQDRTLSIDEVVRRFEAMESKLLCAPKIYPTTLTGSAGR